MPFDLSGFGRAAFAPKKAVVSSPPPALDQEVFSASSTDTDSDLEATSHSREDSLRSEDSSEEMGDGLESVEGKGGKSKGKRSRISPEAHLHILFFHPSAPGVRQTVQKLGKDGSSRACAAPLPKAYRQKGGLSYLTRFLKGLPSECLDAEWTLLEDTSLLKSEGLKKTLEGPIGGDMVPLVCKVLANTKSSAALAGASTAAGKAAAAAGMEGAKRETNPVEVSPELCVVEILVPKILINKTRLPPLHPEERPVWDGSVPEEYFGKIVGAWDEANGYVVPATGHGPTFKLLSHLSENAQPVVLSTPKMVVEKKKKARKGKVRGPAPVVEAKPLGGQRRSVMIFSHGGHFSAGVFVGGECTKHKSFSRYMVRKKAGGLQGNADSHSGRKIKSIGSQIRRANAKAMEEDVEELLTEWKNDLAASDIIFLSAPGRNRLRLSSSVALKDERVRKIPSWASGHRALLKCVHAADAHMRTLVFTCTPVAQK